MYSKLFSNSRHIPIFTLFAKHLLFKILTLLMHIQNYLVDIYPILKDIQFFQLVIVWFWMSKYRN